MLLGVTTQSPSKKENIRYDAMLAIKSWQV